MLHSFPRTENKHIAHTQEVEFVFFLVSSIVILFVMLYLFASDFIKNIKNEQFPVSLSVAVSFSTSRSRQTQTQRCLTFILTLSSHL